MSHPSASLIFIVCFVFACANFVCIKVEGGRQLKSPAEMPMREFFGSFLLRVLQFSLLSVAQFADGNFSRVASLSVKLKLVMGADGKNKVAYLCMWFD